jgi:UDPglucose--hexose-1-phosphate uridylyltransferase
MQPPDPAVDPFAPGNEHLTPHELYALRTPGTAPDSPGWQLRVVPNRYPALRVEGDLAPRQDGAFASMNGVGAHEVVIETPDVGLTMRDYSVEQITVVLEAIRLRMADLAHDRRLVCVLAFKNHGLAAGATLSHSHSQLAGLPLLPLRLELELQALQHGWRNGGVSLQRAAFEQELAEGRRIVSSNDQAVAFCPFASANQFEVHLYPRLALSDFRNAGVELLAGVAALLKQVLQAWHGQLGDIAYNIVLRSAPFSGAFSAVESRYPDFERYYQWHIEMIPRMSRAAGFEWASGFSINAVPPEEAAAALSGKRS